MCALIALGYVTASQKDLAVILLVVAIGINAATYLGFQVSHPKEILIESVKLMWSTLTGQSH